MNRSFWCAWPRRFCASQSCGAQGRVSHFQNRDAALALLYESSEHRRALRIGVHLQPGEELVRVLVLAHVQRFSVVVFEGPPEGRRPVAVAITQRQVGKRGLHSTATAWTLGSETEGRVDVCPTDTQGRQQGDHQVFELDDARSRHCTDCTFTGCSPEAGRKRCRGAVAWTPLSRTGPGGEWMAA